MSIRKSVQRFSIFTLGSLFGTVLVFTGAHITYAAWLDPTTDPPNGNIDVPVNVGTASQTKSGALNIDNTFTVNTDKFKVTSVGVMTVGTNVFEANAVAGEVYIGTNIGSDKGRLQAYTGPSSNKPAISAVSGDASNPAIFARNEAGPGLKSEVVTSTFAALHGKAEAQNSYGVYGEATQPQSYGVLGRISSGTSNPTDFSDYAAGVKGEADISAVLVNQGVAGVVGVASGLDPVGGYPDQTVYAHGVLGVGSDIVDAQSGTSPRVSAGVYAQGGNIEDGPNLSVKTYGIYAKEGTKTGNGTVWAGYFEGDVKAKGNLEVTETLEAKQGIINNDDDSKEFALDVTKTGEPGGDRRSAAVFRGTAGTVYAGGMANFRNFLEGILQISPPTEEHNYAERQLVLDADGQAFFSYNPDPDEKCVELWVPNPTPVANEAPSILAAQWPEGNSCTPACASKCYAVGGGRECSTYGMYEPTDGKCLRLPGSFNIQYTCCKPSGL
ncbi:MAG: hypothetical protein HYV34_02215 [Candidatus Kerfeldbacteria bacterium]|nr:hypothetical protein [Candidatus Kerfeldbacteria bacterium]